MVCGACCCVLLVWRDVWCVVCVFSRSRLLWVVLVVVVCWLFVCGVLCVLVCMLLAGWLCGCVSMCVMCAGVCCVMFAVACCVLMLVVV